MQPQFFVVRASRSEARTQRIGVAAGRDMTANADMRLAECKLKAGLIPRRDRDGRQLQRKQR